MGIHKRSDEDNPPSSTCPLTTECHDIGLPISRNGGADYCEDAAGADLMSFPYMSHPVNPFHWENTNTAYLTDTQGIPVHSGVSMADFMKFNLQGVPQHMTSMAPGNPNPWEIAFPQQIWRGMHQSTTHDNSANIIMDEGINALGFQNPQAYRNILPMANNPEVGRQFNIQGKEASVQTFARPQSNRHIAILQGSRPMLHHPQSNVEIKAENNAEVNTYQSGSLENIDGSFLSLGPEVKFGTRPSRCFSGQEISSQLEEAASPKFITSHVGYGIRGPPSQSQSLGVGFSNSQNSTGGLAIPERSVAGLTNKTEAGITCGASTGLSSRPFHISQTPQVDMQQKMVRLPSNRISGSVSNIDPKNGNFRGDQVQHAPSGVYNSGTTSFPLSKQNRLPGLGSDNSSVIDAVTAAHQLHNMQSALNYTLESSLRSHRLGRAGSRHGHSAHEGRAIAAAGSNLLPNANHFQATSTAASGVFPKRLGVQGYTAQALEGSSVPVNTGVQTANENSRSLHNIPVHYCKDLRPPTIGEHRQSLHNVPVQFHNDLRPPFTIGQSEVMPVQPHANYRGPSTATGQPLYSVPVQNWRPMSTTGRPLYTVPVQNWRPVSTTGQGIPVAKINKVPSVCEVHGRSSLKRGAVHPPPDAPLVHRRKLLREPALSPVSYRPTTAPAPLPIAAAARPSVPVFDHIKWEGADEQPEPTGDKCLICKRDLIFSPEGPVKQPPVPPPVAVLPCGHTFHDHCLQQITPEDQSKSPPCIPCAIGEN